VGVQEVKWDRVGTVPADKYTSFYGKGEQNHKSGTGPSVHKRIISAVRKMVEPVSDGMSYILLRGSGCHIIALNVYASTEDKMDDLVTYMIESCYGPSMAAICHSLNNGFMKELKSVFDKFPKNHMQNVVNFNAKVGREDIFKPRIGNDSSHKISNDNRIRVVNFATFKNPSIKRTMFPHTNIHNVTLTYPTDKTQIQIDHI
jgi:hypothetical protein